MWAYITSHYDWQAFYLTASLVVCGLALAGRDHVVQKTSLVLFIGCVVSNILVNAEITPPTLQLFNSIMDLSMLCLIGHIGYTNQHRLGVIVCGLFVVMMGLHVFTLAIAHGPSRPYKLILNYLFAAQLLASASWGIKDIVGRHLYNRRNVLFAHRHGHIRADYK